MKIFGQLVRTVVNVACLPIDAVKDAVTLGPINASDGRSSLVKRLEKLKDEASE